MFSYNSSQNVLSELPAQLFLAGFECLCTRVCDCRRYYYLKNDTVISSKSCSLHTLFPIPNPHCRVEKHWFEEVV